MNTLSLQAWDFCRPSVLLNPPVTVPGEWEGLICAYPLNGWMHGWTRGQSNFHLYIYPFKKMLNTFYSIYTSGLLTYLRHYSRTNLRACFTTYTNLSTVRILLGFIPFQLNS